MSAPRRRKPKRGISRRDFLRRSLPVAALGFAPMLPGCGGDGARSSAGTGEVVAFRHGVASGDPLTDRVVLWTRVSGDAAAVIPVELTLASDAQFTQNLRSLMTEARPERDHTVKVDMQGLSPGTTYYYRFRALGQDSPIGRTRTLPQGAVNRLRIAVLSCSSYAHGFFNAYARVAERADLDLVLHLGDYIYEYGNGGYGNARDYEPPHEIVTLDDYRTRHAYYRLEPELQALHRQHPAICVWDDHESANDSWRDGAENHQPDIEGAWTARKLAAQRAYEEWMPIRAPDPARIFRNFQIGDLVELLMLDTRLFARSQPLPPNLNLADLPDLPVLPSLPLQAFAATGAYQDPTRTLLGDEQEQWLIARLRGTGARWKLLGQQVMFGQLKLLGLPNAAGLSQFLNPDQWDGYPVARSRIFSALRGDSLNAPVNNTVLLTGDIHTAWAMDLSEDPNNLLPALGGYNALTGEGSLGVEFVATSVTSPGLEALAPIQDVIRLQNPHIKYVDLARKGYLLLDITPERCQGEFWAVDGVAKRGGGERFQAAYRTLDGGNRLRVGTASLPRPDAPALAP
ncbi:MAG: alkaline phosphatase D family protein [Panacagrimonas sp.]